MPQCRNPRDRAPFSHVKIRREWIPCVFPSKRPKRDCLTDLITEAGYGRFYIEVSIPMNRDTGLGEKSSNMFIMFHL